MPKRRKNEDDDSGKGKTKLSKKTHPDDSNQDDSNNSSAIPIFLKKTYRMIETCDPEVCSWTTDGEMFVVKHPVSGLIIILLLLPHVNSLIFLFSAMFT